MFGVAGPGKGRVQITLIPGRKCDRALAGVEAALAGETTITSTRGVEAMVIEYQPQAMCPICGQWWIIYEAAAG